MRSRARNTWLGSALGLTLLCSGALAAEATAVGDNGFEILMRQPSRFSLFNEREARGGLSFLGEPLQILEPQPTVDLAALLGPAFSESEGEAVAITTHLMPKGRRFMVGDNRMDTVSWVTTGVLAAGLGALLLGDNFDTIAEVGDVTQLIPLAYALPMTFYAKDRQGFYQLSKSGLASFVAVHGIKQSVEKWRPDLSDTNSFPSGHTNAAFVGAAFLQRRYGPRWGVPAYVLASYTGLSRVAGNKHFTDDVVGGMSIALLTNWLFVNPMDDRFLVTPIAGDGQVGLQVAVTTGGGSDAAEVKGPWVDRQRQLRFEFEFCGAWVRVNDVTAPADGTTIDWHFNEESNPTTTSAAGINWYPKGSKRHELLLRLSPFEVRDIGVFEEDTEFAGETFPAGEPLRSRYIFYEWRTRYRYNFFPDSRFVFKLGAAASLQDVLVDLIGGEDPESTEDPELFAEVEEIAVVPLAHIHLGYEFGGWLELFAEADGAVFGVEEDFVDYSFQLRAQITRRWDVSAGFRRFEYRFTTDDLKNDFDLDRWLIGFGYSW